MIPLRLVIDTNIVVSAALKPDGLQRTVLLLAITKPARLYVSEVVIAEYREVLARPELKIRKGLRQQVLQLIRSYSQIVTPSRPLQITPDPDDNIFLECADAAHAEAWIKCASRWTRTGYKAPAPDERATYREVHIHQGYEA